jgi:hypothetical protein
MQFCVTILLAFIGYYRTILIRNQADETSKYISGVLRRILAISDEYSDVRQPTVLVQRCEDYNAILRYNLIYIQMGITERS